MIRRPSCEILLSNTLGEAEIRVANILKSEPEFNHELLEKLKEYLESIWTVCNDPWEDPHTLCVEFCEGDRWGGTIKTQMLFGVPCTSIIVQVPTFFMGKPLPSFSILTNPLCQHFTKNLLEVFYHELVHWDQRKKVLSKLGSVVNEETIRKMNNIIQKRNLSPAYRNKQELQAHACSVAYSTMWMFERYDEAFDFITSHFIEIAKTYPFLNEVIQTGREFEKIYKYFMNMARSYLYRFHECQMEMA